MAYDSDQGFPRRRATVESGKASHKGLLRSSNEDSLLALEMVLEKAPKGIFFGIYAVADGVGGHEGGEIASALSLQVIAESLVMSLLLPGLRSEIFELNQEAVLQALSAGVKAANAEIYAQAQVKGNAMGTTVACALVINNSAYIANVGDSRVYLLCKEQLQQVTTDHSLVAELVAAGQIAPEDIYTHPKRNIITRCLGTRQDIEIDLFTKELRSGDSLLLCSDGLWEMVMDDDIKKVLLQSPGSQAACEQMVEMANQNGGLDNISVIAVRVTGLRR